MSAQLIKDFLGLPFIFILSNDVVERMGLTSLRMRRLQACLDHCTGKVLDIGCGEGNRLVKKWGNGVGVDVYPWPEVDKVCDTTQLPFEDASFDTVTLVASLNHIPERGKVLKEACRVLKPGGTLLITFLDPFIGFIRHKLSWWDKDQHQRGMKEGEVWGLWPEEVKTLMEEAGFAWKGRKRFAFRMNCLYIGEKSVKREQGT